MATSYTPGNWNYATPQLPTLNQGTPVRQPNYTPPGSVQSTPWQTTYKPDKPEPTNMWGNAPGANPANQAPIYNMYDPATYQGANYDQANRYLSSWYWPQYEAQQNSYQWGSEFDEAQRRYNQDYGLQSTMNQYNMDLQTRQQQMAEWEANQASNQWGQQFDWTKTTDTWSKQLAEAQLAQQLQQLREQLAAEQAMANVAAYGRAEKPNARFVRNWG